MRLLRSPRPPAIERYFRYMVNSVNSPTMGLGLDITHLEPIDYETIFDLTHGMPLIAVFGDGSRATLNMDAKSLTVLRDKLKTLNVIHVLYVPESLEKIRYVLKQACLQMNLTNCDSYDDYIGLMENRVRVFSRAEEQALKWATIFQTPTFYTAHSFRENSSTKEELTARIEMQRNVRLVASAAILKGIFNSGVADRLFQEVAVGYINDSFDRLTNLTADNVVIFSRKPNE